MRKAHMLVGLLVVLSLLPALVYGQHDVRVPPYIVNSTFLNNYIVGDTLANGARRDSAAVYVLQRGGTYLSQAVITNGYPLNFKTHDTTAGISYPIIYLYPNATTLNPPGQFITMRANVSMKKIILSGYFEPGNYALKDTSYLNHLQGALFNTNIAGLTLTLDSCILTNTNGNHVRTDQPPKKLQITNCKFVDMGFLGRSNLGAGKAIDVRAGSVDSFIVVNNTFVNWQDRIIRHFSSTANIQYLRFEHNTCVNGMSYHGMLSLGRTGKRVIMNNNLFYDGFALGADSDAVRQAEFTDSGEKDAFGFARMTWVLSVPNDSTAWTVKNNYHVVSPTGKAFFDSASVWPIVANPPLTEGSPLTYHINSRIGADSTTAFKKVTTTLPNIPKLMVAMMKWYRTPKASLGSGKTKETTNWKPEFDFDRRSIEYYRDTLNCAYSTADPIYSAGSGGYPIGDLNWFPARYTAWKADPVSDVQPVGGEVPVAFSLEQNYPNPFNPSTTIRFDLPNASPVRLSVFDVLGREVSVLVNDQIAAGVHEVSFDAKQFASGMYVYRLQAGNFVQTRKMLFLK
ncbi:MAG: hypothetical protein H6Q31_1003 [Bacteroidetes bacterium]|nr:hypothetical protein [Bacteroidota bacterium]